MTITTAGASFDRWDELLALILESFASMHGRIDPPSSALRLTPAALEERSGRETLLLAWDRGRLAGCAFVERRASAAYLGKLAVLPAMQGRGIGRRLIGEAERLARSWSLPFLELQTRIELTENHAAFTRLGFTEIARHAHPGYDRPTSITFRKPIGHRTRIHEDMPR